MMGSWRRTTDEASAPVGHRMARPRVLILVENLSVPFDRRPWLEARTLAGAGYEVAVVCPQGANGDRDLYAYEEGIAIHRFRPSPSPGGAIGYLSEYASACRQISRLARSLARLAPFDVVHACNPPDLLLPAVLPLRRQGTRFVFDHHDLVPELYLSRFGRGKDVFYYGARLAERLTFRLADVVIATNDSYREIAIRRGGKRPEDVFVVRNGPELTDLSGARPHIPLKRGKPHLIAYVGMMGPQDGVDHALRALAALRERRGDWHAVFVGGGDALESARELSRELRLTEQVEFTGLRGREEVGRVLATADVCLSPEPKDPLNDVSTMIKVAEYMAARRPVVAFDLTETRVTAGAAGVYAKANDVNDFAAQIDLLLRQPDLRRMLGELGRRRVEQELKWEYASQRLLAAYECALDGANARGKVPRSSGVLERLSD